MTRSLHVFHLKCRGENNVSRKKLSNIILYLKRNNCVLKHSFYRVFIIARWMTTSLIPPITLCLSPFSLDVYLIDDISFRVYFQRVFSADERLCCFTRLITCTFLMFHPCLVSHLLGDRTTNVALVKV